MSSPSISAPVTHQTQPVSPNSHCSDMLEAVDRGMANITSPMLHSVSEKTKTFVGDLSRDIRRKTNATRKFDTNPTSPSTAMAAPMTLQNTQGYVS